MRNKKIIESWGKVKADDATHERILNNILDRIHSGEAKKGSEFNMNIRPFWKILAPITACVIIALAIAVPTIMQNSGSHVPPNQGNGEHGHPVHMLTFNTSGSLMSASIDRRIDIFYDNFTAEQMSAVFPGLHLTLEAVALYLSDGSLIEVSAFELESGVRIRLAPGALTHTVLIYFEEDPEISYVHGVAVTAFKSGDYGFAFYLADFMLNGIEYRVEMSGTDEHIDIMTEIVSMLIIGGAADLSVLADPVIPELRNEEMTLAEAQSDPDFGAFLPASIPGGFRFDNAWRFIDQHSNGLLVFWDAGMDYIRWGISKPTEHDMDRVVSVDDREKFDLSLYPIPWMDSVPRELIEFVTNPVFLSNELTLEAVQARVMQSDRGRGDAQSLQINFGVLHNDVVITIFVNGLSPEQVWDMLSDVIG